MTTSPPITPLMLPMPMPEHDSPSTLRRRRQLLARTDRRAEKQRILAEIDHRTDRLRAGFQYRGSGRFARFLENVDTLTVNLSARFNSRATQQDLDTALAWAARNGQTRRASRLMSRGVDIHANDDAALVLAAIHQHPKTFRALLKKGAEPDALRRDPRAKFALSSWDRTPALDAIREALREKRGPSPHPRPGPTPL